MNKGRKITGGKYHALRKKKLYEHKGQERHVTLGDTKRKTMRVKGANIKTVMLKSSIVNINIKGKTQKAEITNVVETPQNKFFARQNRLMKGALIDTSMGKAKITNRPSQEGCINAILVDKK
jgi:small subunit ribosomal protein S8e